MGNDESPEAGWEAKGEVQEKNHSGLGISQERWGEGNWYSTQGRVGFAHKDVVSCALKQCLTSAQMFPGPKHSAPCWERSSHS